MLTSLTQATHAKHALNPYQASSHQEPPPPPKPRNTCGPNNRPLSPSSVLILPESLAPCQSEPSPLNKLSQDILQLILKNLTVLNLLNASSTSRAFAVAAKDALNKCKEVLSKREYLEKPPLCLHEYNVVTDTFLAMHQIDLDTEAAKFNTLLKNIVSEISQHLVPEENTELAGLLKKILPHIALLYTLEDTADENKQSSFSFEKSPTQLSINVINKQTHKPETLHLSTLGNPINFLGELDTEGRACGMGYLKFAEEKGSCLGTFSNQIFNEGLLDTETYTFEGTITPNHDKTYTLKGRIHIKESKIIGHGTFTAASNLTLLSAQGIQFHPNLSTLYGKWNAEGAQGACTLSFPTGYQFEGFFENDKPTTGKLTAPDGSSIQDRPSKINYAYFNTPKHPYSFKGPGTYVSASGLTIKGQFENSKLEGAFTGKDKQGNSFSGMAATGIISEINYANTSLKETQARLPEQIIFGNPLLPAQS